MSALRHHQQLVALIATRHLLDAVVELNFLRSAEDGTNAGEHCGITTLYVGRLALSNILAPTVAFNVILGTFAVVRGLDAPDSAA